MSAAEPIGQALSDDGTRVLELLASLVDPLWRSLSTESEVVLHEIGLLPNSVVAISGSVTGRQVGDPTELDDPGRVHNGVEGARQVDRLHRGWVGEVGDHDGGAAECDP